MTSGDCFVFKLSATNVCSPTSVQQRKVLQLPINTLFVLLREHHLCRSCYYTGVKHPKCWLVVSFDGQLFMVDEDYIVHLAKR